MTIYYINRWTLRAQHRQLADAILFTMLPAFSDIDQKVQVFSQELEGVDCWSDDPCHSEDEYRAERVTVFDDELRSVEAAMVGMAVVALYRLWERSIKDLIAGKYRPHRLSEIKITSLLDDANLPQPCRGALDVLDEGRLIANVIKHGDGNSADTLRQKDPELFRRPWNDDNFNRITGSSADTGKGRKERPLRLVVAEGGHGAFEPREAHPTTCRGVGGAWDVRGNLCDVTPCPAVQRRKCCLCLVWIPPKFGPRNARHSILQMASPMPLPSYASAVCRRWKMPKMRSNWDGSMPMPLSCTKKAQQVG